MTSVWLISNCGATNAKGMRDGSIRAVFIAVQTCGLKFKPLSNGIFSGHFEVSIECLQKARNSAKYCA
jgi:hypothetical protein